MNDSFWFWVLGGVLLFLVFKKKGSTTTGTSGAAGALPNTNTASSAPAPWLSSLSNDVQAILGTNSTVGSEISTGASGLNTIYGLFGGSSSATGTPSPSTSGSGTGVVNNSQAGDNSGSGSPDLLSYVNPPTSPAGFDTFSLSDFGGSGTDLTAAGQ